jgi:hypothetical protein
MDKESPKSTNDNTDKKTPKGTNDDTDKKTPKAINGDSDKEPSKDISWAEYWSRFSYFHQSPVIKMSYHFVSKFTSNLDRFFDFHYLDQLHLVSTRL